MHFNLDGIQLPIDTIPREKQVIVYGVGDIAEKYTDLLEKIYGTNKIAYYLVSEINSETKFHGKEILSFQRLQELQKNSYYYIIASFSAVRTMRKNLLQYGIEEENIHETIDFWSVEVMKEVSEEIKDIYFYPHIESEEQLNRILNIIEEINLDNVLFHASLSPTLDCSEKAKLPLSLNSTNEVYQPRKKDFVLIWNSEYLFDNKLNDVIHKFCVDKTISENTTAKLINCIHYCSHSKKYSELSKRNWQSLIDKYQGRDSLIFGNGPTLDLFLGGSNQIASYIKVVCNQMYLNQTAMDKINPNLYLLYDHAYFMEDNIDILEDILSIIKRYDCYLIVPLIFMPALMSRKNIDENKVIGIDTYGNDIGFVTKDKLEVKRMYSVITTLGVPVVSYLSSSVYFVGCDGKKQMENGEFFWPYAAALKEEIESIKYEKISKESNEIKLGYEQHCNEFEKLITYGENLGKTYSSLTKSYIPVLMKNYKELY